MSKKSQGTRCRVLIADDSGLFTELLQRILGTDPQIEVVGTVEDGAEAVNATARLRPDIVLLDIHLPILSGIQAIGKIMARVPTPILAMTADPDRSIGFEALRRGALDLIAKETHFPPTTEFVKNLCHKLKVLAQVPVVRHPDQDSLEREPMGRAKAQPLIIGLVASTGGPAALAEILGNLPKTFPLPILIVQHMADHFNSAFVTWLANQTALDLRLANQGELLRRGCVRVAPANRHLILGPRLTSELHDAPPDCGHRPSGDVLLASLARQAGPTAAGIVLTGMGEDGGRGLLEIRRSGGRTFAQDRESSVIFGMPGFAESIGAAEKLLPLARISKQLLALAQGVG